jgi:hypothetical protein
MMSLEAIRELSREAAEQAAEEQQEPYRVEQEDIDDARARLKAGRTPRFRFPFLGDYIPEGWARTDTAPLFADSSGFGRESEPALTPRQLVEKLRAGYGYAIIAAGQFQAYVAEYEEV